MTYAEERRMLDVERRDAENELRARILERIATIRLENDETAPRAPTERAYRKGWNESLGDLERWLQQPRSER